MPHSAVVSSSSFSYGGGESGVRHKGSACADVSRALESATALLFLQLVFPDSMPVVVRRLAWIGAVSTGAQAAASALPQRHRARLERGLRCRGAQILGRLESTKYLRRNGLRGEPPPYASTSSL